MAVNRLWVADITYVRLAEEFVYLAVILDAFSRKVIGWALEDHLQASLAIAALEMALAGRDVRRGELIHHSDRGVQYACGDYIDRLEQAGIQPSMSRAGCPYDNAMAEKLMKTTKPSRPKRSMPPSIAISPTPEAPSPASSTTSTIDRDCTRPWIIGHQRSSN